MHASSGSLGLRVYVVVLACLSVKKQWKDRQRTVTDTYLGMEMGVWDGGGGDGEDEHRHGNGIFK